MGKRAKFFFANGLQKAVVLLRNGGLLEDGQFPELLTPIKIRKEAKRNTEGQIIEVQSYLVLIKVRDSFCPSKLWLKFDRRGQSIYVSQALEDWVCINKFKHITE